MQLRLHRWNETGELRHQPDDEDEEDEFEDDGADEEDDEDFDDDDFDDDDFDELEDVDGGNLDEDADEKAEE